MNIQTFITLYVVSIPLFFIIDMLWLGFFAKDFYQNRLGYLLGEVGWGAALLFYGLFIVGLTFFASYPAAMAGQVGKAVLLGAAFGFFTYMTYDLTNQATIRDWPIIVTMVDIVWGTVLGAVVSGGAVFIVTSYWQ